MCIQSSFAQLLSDSFKANYGQLAAIYQNTKLSYEQIHNKSIQLARVLAAQKGTDTILIHCDDKLLYLQAICAAIFLGIPYVPLDPCTPINRVKVILNELEAAKLNPYVIGNDNASTLDAILSQEYEDFSLPVIEPSRIIYIMFTSGTTGVPKGIKVKESNVLNYFEHVIAKNYMKLEVGEYFIQNTAFSFDLSILTIFWPLLNGTTLIFPKNSKDPAENVHLIQQYKIRVFHASPSLTSMCASLSDFNKCTSLKFLMGGGEPWKRNLLNKVYHAHPQCHFLNLYGPTELTINVTTWHCTDLSNLPSEIPIGVPINNNTVKVVDNKLNEVAEGTTGELLFTGKAVTDGYLGTQAKTDGFMNIKGERSYLTGDMGYIKSGVLFYKGRKDNQIKIRGNRVQLEEIEFHLQKILPKAVVSVLKITIDDIEKLVAFIISENDTINAADIRSSLAEDLPAYMIPHEYCILNNFRTNTNGKIDKEYLKNEYLANKTFEKTADESKDKFLNVWQQVLEKPIRYDSNFFTNGGDSLLAMNLVIELENRLGIKVGIVDIFKHPTPKALLSSLKEEATT